MRSATLDAMVQNDRFHTGFVSKTEITTYFVLGPWRGLRALLAASISTFAVKPQRGSKYHTHGDEGTGLPERQQIHQGTNSIQFVSGGELVTGLHWSTECTDQAIAHDNGMRLDAVGGGERERRAGA